MVPARENHCLLKAKTVAPEINMATASIIKYTSLTSMPGVGLKVLVQSSSQYVDGSILDDNSNLVFQTTIEIAAMPMRNRIAARAYPNLYRRNVAFIRCSPFLSGTSFERYLS